MGALQKQEELPDEVLEQLKSEGFLWTTKPNAIGISRKKADYHQHLIKIHKVNFVKYDHDKNYRISFHVEYSQNADLTSWYESKSYEISYMRSHDFIELDIPLEELIETSEKVLSGEISLDVFADKSNVDLNSETALVGKGSKEFLLVMKSTLTEKTNRLELVKAGVQMQIARKMAELEKVRSAMGVMVAEFQEKINQIERIITIIELYLGVEEELHQLASGAEAAEGEPISFRQLVLFMDEELAYHLEGDSAEDFDWRDVKHFDEWVTKPKNLEYILPEKKGFVALKVRRENIDYGDARVNSRTNKWNTIETYFLIRNGENIYRIFTDKLIVFGRMFPKKTEIQEMFAKVDSSHWKERDQKEADNLMYYYKKLAMFFQGLIDRTIVFGAIQGKVSLLTGILPEDKVNFIYDDDDNLLSDGRLSFDEWKKSINEKITKGSHVLITGKYRRYGYAGGKDFEDRLFKYYMNDHNIPAPPHEGVYLVDTKTREAGYRRKEAYEALVIKHNPEDKVWGGWGKGAETRKNRVTFEIFKRDEWVLNYDQISLEDVEYYLTDRSQRKNYLDMMPVLKRVREHRLEELEKEKHFVQFMLDELARAKTPATEADVWEAVDWWKHKNMWKRPIDKDDAKAYRMILKHLSK